MCINIYKNRTFAEDQGDGNEKNTEPQQRVAAMTAKGQQELEVWEEFDHSS